jgi:hypothetical protein
MEAAKKAATPRKGVASKTSPKAPPAKTASAKETPKTAVKKAAPRPATGPSKLKGNGEVTTPKKVSKSARTIGGVTPEQRYRMVCDAAYFRAERRGFVGGNAVQDWLDAESEIDELLSEMQE